MYTHAVNNYFVSEEFLDDALAELTELADNRDWVQAMWASSSAKLNNLRDELTDFVRDSSDVTDARAIIEALCDRFALDATREVQTRVTIEVNVTADAPYTMTKSEIIEALSNLIIDIDSYDSDMEIHFDVVDTYVDEIQEA